MIIIVELWYSALANPSSSWSFKAAVYFFLPGGRGKEGGGGVERGREREKGEGEREREGGGDEREREEGWRERGREGGV